MEAVLPVEDEAKVDLSGIVSRMQQGIPPADVQEYLWRVRIEAQGIPNVVVSSVDPRQYDANQTKTTAIDKSQVLYGQVAHKQMLPDGAWRDEVLAEFADLRQLIVHWQDIGVPPPRAEEKDDETSQEPVKEHVPVPRMSDEAGWQRFFFGKTTQHKEAETEEEQVQPAQTPAEQIMEASDDGMGDHGTPPSLRLMLQFDQILTRRLLEHHVAWLEDAQLSRARGVWIYALLARLDKPVHATVAANIRQLLRRCVQLRSVLQDPNDPRLKPLNVLITIAGEFFGQMDAPA